MTRTILILGGTTEAYALAEALAADPHFAPFSSLAGRTKTPRLPAGEVRIGGFGGAEGMAAWIRAHDIAAIVDATHPFAARIGWNAAQAAAMTGVPLLRLDRPAWEAQPGDYWEPVDSWDEAALIVGLDSRRVLLALGRQELAPFAGLDDVWFLIRSVDRPDPLPPFAQAEVMLARGPFTLEGERELLEHHAIDTIVCKNSGGDATDAKLIAARELGIRVVMKRRPPHPDTARAATIAQALEWLRLTLP
jgi:precorrin-6A/cobalt-precorrin-6A reductase